MYLHILHRIRLLGMMTGVFGADSEGVCGCLANMSSDGREPSPSKMIRLASYLPGDNHTWRTRGHHSLMTSSSVLSM